MTATLARFEFSRFLQVGTPKILLHAGPDDDEEALHHRIVAACQIIRNYPGIF
jgi:hypothetical protein